MSKTKWHVKAIYMFVAVALVLGFALAPAIQAAFNTYAGYTFSKDGSGTAVWSTTAKHSGSYSAKLTAPAAADYARVKVPITSTPLSTFNAPSFWYRIADASAATSTENIGNTWPMYVRSADTVGQGYLSAYPIIYIKNNGIEHWIIGQPWAEATAVDWTQWSNAQASKVHTEALWHMENFSVNPDVGGQVPAGWGPLSYWKTFYSTFNVLDVRVGIGYFTGLTGQQAAFVDDLTINPTYDFQPLAIENSCYKTGNTVNIKVLKGGTAPLPGTLAVYVYSTTTGWDGKITISAAGDGTGIYSGSFQLVNTTPGPGQLLVNNGDTITIRHTGDWGTGSVTHEDTAIVDDTAPTVALTSGASDPTKNSPIPVTATFSEAVTGFVAGDVVVSNGTVINFVAQSGTVYTFDVTPTAQGAVTVNIPAGAAQDCPGNNNTAATQLSRTFDNVRPTVGLTTPAPDPFNTATFTVTATFGEAVTGFDAGDLTVGNGTKGTFTAVSGSEYTCVITPTNQGAVTVNVAEGAAQDAATNTNTAATQLSRTWDTVQPGVTLTSGTVANSGTTDVSPVLFTATFTESVGTSFVVGDITVTNGAAGNFAGGPTVFTFNVVPAVGGTVTVGVAAGTAQDAAGNLNTVSTPNPFTFTFVVINPTCTLGSTAPATTNTSPIPVTATFSAAVTGFEVGDITVGNGSANTLAGGPTVYTFNVVPAGQGAVTVNVAAGVCVDAQSRPNLAATQLSRTFDSVGPTCVLSAPNPTNSTPFTLTITFNEAVQNFVVSDVTVTGAEKGTLAGGTTVWTLPLTPTAATVTANVAASTCTDTTGNNNTASNTLNVKYSANGFNLAAQWNLMSPNLIPNNTAIGTVLADISSDVQAVWYYDATVVAPANPWKGWSPINPSPTLTTMEDGKGYQVQMANARTLIIDGLEQPAPGSMLPPPSYNVVVGWNMIGFKSLTAQKGDTYLLGVAAKYTKVYKWDNATQTYVPVNTAADNSFVPGLGYWGAFTAPGTIYP